MYMTESVPDSLLMIALVILVLLLAFFSASEIGMMSLNRYRLKHLAKTDNRARRINRLLSRPDRLLGAILIGNTFTTTGASTIATILGAKFGNEAGIVLAPLALGLVLLILAEMMPKTLGALKPERTAYYTLFPLQVVLWLLHPLVWVTSGVSNGLLKLIGVNLSARKIDTLNREELRTIVHEATVLIPSHHQMMLLSILDLEKMTVEDVMIPRNDVIGINLADTEKDLSTQYLEQTHTLLPVYRDDLDNIQGVIHARDILQLLAQERLNEKELLHVSQEPYFIPEGTSLPSQLLNFQRNNQRLGFVVDEYGDVLGLVTLEDILGEIVGEFNVGLNRTHPAVQIQEDGSYLIDGSANIRDLNRFQQWELPTDGPKTLSGLIIEYLEAIPKPGTSLLIERYSIEVIEMQDNTVKTARVSIPSPSESSPISDILEIE